MPNREKVIRNLRYLKSFGRVSNNPQITEIAENAIALLKKQIPIAPIKGEHGKCPICGYQADHKYCPNCGQAFDWDL